MEQGSLGSMDERGMVGDCLAGRAGAYQRLAEAFGPLVMSVALNIVGNREDAEDVFQETLVQVFRNLDRYDPERSFKTWLLTIVYRRSLDMIRKKRRFSEFASRARHEPAVLTGNPGPPEAGSGPLPSRLLEKLSPKERTALCLWANEGYTARDIAGVLGCAAGTARVLLFTARRKIKALLENGHVHL